MLYNNMITSSVITDHSFFLAERNRENGRNFYHNNKNTKIKCDVCGNCFKLPYIYRHQKTKRHLNNLKKITTNV